jgi:dTMP kinase
MEILNRFIVIEGLDGSGTTTQTALLKDHLEKLRLRAAATFEPTDSVIGKLIRDVLSGRIQVTDGALALLYAADRDNHIYNQTDGLLSLLEENDVVISDRYLFSSLVYQGLQIPQSRVEAYNSFFPLPEILVYIDTPAEECLRRLHNRGAEKEIFEVESFQRQVYARYNDVLASLPGEVLKLRIDGTQTAVEIADEIMEGLAQIMNIASP